MYLDGFHNLKSQRYSRIEAGHRVWKIIIATSAPTEVATFLLGNALPDLSVKEQVFRHHAARIDKPRLSPAS